ncbi:hypothetical protein N7474_001698 [Penicillium riverlandense]|uniref:uncharacterized protein n=1 Tax=Penicillium riverlandense TaxID=1903569 RepID=UPI002547095D|nr:uncharacterized protein N7474_001698 [Penicillium riverlandense]KAJ5833387.1 hypothetical protein N7474_001698 [Penicillium riverlandense]
MSLFSYRGLDALFSRPRLGVWQQFQDHPCLFLARKLYTWQQTIPAQPLADPVSIVCISDTHNYEPELPHADILIHAGDLTQSGTFKELQAAINWLRAQPHPTKIVVAGNHDLLLDPECDARTNPQGAAERKMLDWGDIIYLENAETTTVCANGRRLRIYGSPQSARYGTPAFQYPREKDVWADAVPHGIDVLITHGPPRAHLDRLGLGCVHLLRKLWSAQPRLHVFGHVHEGAGTEWLQFDALQDAYEGTVAAGGGLCNILRTFREFVRALCRPATEARCLLVNACTIGGFRDEERRQPIKIIM